MNFKIDDILNDTIDGISKEMLSEIISEIINGTDIVVATDETNK